MDSLIGMQIYYKINKYETYMGITIFTLTIKKIKIIRFNTIY